MSELLDSDVCTFHCAAGRDHRNMLFRGDLPITSNKTYAYDELVSTMTKAAKGANLTFPSTFYLIDLR